MDRNKKKDYAEIFVDHIEDHLKEMGKEKEEVSCGICGKTLHDIVREETSKGIWIPDGIYKSDTWYTDRNGKQFIIQVMKQN